MVTVHGNVYDDGALVRKGAVITIVEKQIAGTYGKIKLNGKNRMVTKMKSGNWYL